LYQENISLIDLNQLRESHPNLYIIYDSLGKYFLRGSEYSSLDDFEAFFFQSRQLESKQQALFGEIFKTLHEAEVSDLTLADILQSLRERQAILQIAKHSLDVVDGRITTDEFKSLVDHKLDFLETDASQDNADDSCIVTNKITEIISRQQDEDGLHWRLKCLNKSLGPLRKGNFGFVFARPETGKTTFVADQATYMATQAKKQGLGPVVWFNNEQAGEDVMSRIYTSHFAIDADVIADDPETYEKLYEEQIGSSLILYDKALISQTDVVRLCEKYNPSLIIFDQIDKITGFDADRNDLLLGRIYRWARELAKTYCPVIGICQADGTGENVKWLTMMHVADAKTSKQAEADFILGIGVDNNESGAGTVLRYFNISKNKLRGDKNSDRAYRHGRFEVTIKADIGRYEDIYAFT
jgi:replicative DNA helicase